MRRAQFSRFALNPRLLLFAVLLSMPMQLAAQQAQIANQGGNNPPKAIPGPNQKIGVHPNVLAVPTLDGSQSNDPDFDVITFQWKDQSGTIISTSPTVQVVLAFPGTYTYALTVCDTHNACNSNSTQVEVVIDTQPPVVDAPDITVSVTDPGSATVSKSTSLSNYVLNGATTSAVDNVDANPHFVKVVANNATVTSSTVFPEGDTPILVFYTDQAGNNGTASATIHVVDLQGNDIFVQSGEGNCFATPCNDAIQRIRGGSVTHFCTLAGDSTIAGFGGVILDSSGRVVSLRVAPNIAGSSGLEIVRCKTTNAPPESLAWIRNSGPLPAGYNEPFPTLRADNGGGLHLARLRTVVTDDNQNHGDPFVVNEDAYVFDVVTPPTTVFGNDRTTVTKMYHVKQDFWEDGPQLGPVVASRQASGPVGMYFHSGSTYAVDAGCLDRTKIPLNFHATGTLGGVGFNLTLGLFGSSGEICGWILDNVSGPHLTSPPCAGPAPTDGSGLAVMAGFYAVLFDDYKGFGLTLLTNSGATGSSSGVLTAFSELPFDDPGNPSNFFQNPFFGCQVLPEVRFDPLIPPPPAGGFWGPSFIASTPMGLVGTSRFSNGGVVFSLDTGGRTQIATGVEFVGGVAAWPPNVSAGAALSVLIRIDSPVDVLVTDPNGKRLGMLNGVPVNDFGNDGFDSGAGTHPRFYAINNPAPGDFTVQSVGTGTGPYTVHVYSVDTSKPFGQHILSSGNASPGALSNQNFTLGAGGGIAFTNHSPTANAGPDQTLNATSNGTASVSLDGSLSSDPDGDALTFTWAGPFGIATGAQPQVTLPVGVNVLTLTVDDGKGGSASSSVTITVNPLPPPTGLPHISVSLAGQGRLTTDTFFVDLLLTNTGGADALNTSLRDLQFTTLSGSRSVALNLRRNKLPILVGAIPAGASKTVRLYLAAPPSVTLFSLTAAGRFNDAKGETHRFSFTQSLTP